MNRSIIDQRHQHIKYIDRCDYSPRYTFSGELIVHNYLCNDKLFSYFSIRWQRQFRVTAILCSLVAPSSLSLIFLSLKAFIDSDTKSHKTPTEHCVLRIYDRALNRSNKSLNLTVISHVSWSPRHSLTISMVYNPH